MWTISCKMLVITYQTWITRFPCRSRGIRWFFWRGIFLFLFVILSLFLTSWFLLIFAFVKWHGINFGSKSIFWCIISLITNGKSLTRWYSFRLHARRTDHTTIDMKVLTQLWRRRNNESWSGCNGNFVIERAELCVNQIQVLGTSNYFLFCDNSTFCHILSDWWQQGFYEPLS